MKFELACLLLAVSTVALVAAESAEDKILEAFEDRCTSIVVGAKAGVTGPMNTHTADCADCDFRINKVPAADWPEDALRPLYEYKGAYPATITSIRGKTWHPDNLEGTKDQISAWGKESPITGYIPEVKHTYAIYEAGYGIMNEHQLAIGESTCAARFWAAPTTAGGAARIEVREMTKIALERTTNARDAINLMGELATTYGFYAADWSGGDTSMGEGGEALTVVDTKEAWMFHVLADDTGTSAVWVAKRVPDDHVSAVANAFVIRDVDPDDKDMLYSSNIFEVAERNDLWSSKSGKKLDFLKVYGVPRAHSVYATRRVWRVFNMVAPSVELPGDTDYYGSDYPFSIKADKALTAQEVMDLQRDHYEGTKYDLTQGLAAGPFGDPNRFDMAATGDLSMDDVLMGSYERAISLFRTSYSFVSQPRAAVPDELSLLWFAPSAPATTSYAPLYIASDTLPEQYTHGSLFKYDKDVAFWNFCAAGNYAARFWKYAMEMVRDTQADLMDRHLKAMETTEKKVTDMLAANKDADVTDILTAFTHEQAGDVLVSWQELLPNLITVYHDGYIAQSLDQAKISMKKLFYPPSWLDATGYWDNPPSNAPGVIRFEPNPVVEDTVASSATSFSTVFFTAIFSSLMTLLAGVYYLRSKGVQLPSSADGVRINGGGYNALQKNEYVSINL